MIYTVGLTEKYESQIDAGIAVKAGPHANAKGEWQHGGWVWQTPQEARAFLSTRTNGSKRSVYAVMAEWELDTVTVAGEPTRCLSRDALIFRLNSKNGP